MTESRALRLINAVAVTVAAVWVFGLDALGANSSAVALGAIIPTIVAARLSARVVVHYADETGGRKH